MAGWLSWAVDDPAPAENAGYSALNIPRELTNPALRRGLVLHSSEGYWSQSYRPSDTMRARGNSWAVSIMQNGAVYRHRPRPTWVNWHAGGPAQNVGTDGIEMEGKEPWTAAQKVSLVRVLKETRAWFGWPSYAVGAPTNKTQDGIRQALLTRPQPSLWEHRWFDATSCPSFRSEFAWLIPALIEPKEEEMTPEDRTWIGEQLASVVTQLRQRIDEQGGVRDKQASAILAKIAAIQIGSGMTEAECAALVARIELVVR